MGLVVEAAPQQVGHDVGPAGAGVGHGRLQELLQHAGHPLSPRCPPRADGGQQRAELGGAVPASTTPSAGHPGQPSGPAPATAHQAPQLVEGLGLLLDRGHHPPHCLPGHPPFVGQGLQVDGGGAGGLDAEEELGGSAGSIEAVGVGGHETGGA